VVHLGEWRAEGQSADGVRDRSRSAAGARTRHEDVEDLLVSDCCRGDLHHGALRVQSAHLGEVAAEVHSRAAFRRGEKAGVGRLRAASHLLAHFGANAGVLLRVAIDEVCQRTEETVSSTTAFDGLEAVQAELLLCAEGVRGRCA
jgi:hypothetical protein